MSDSHIGFIIVAYAVAAATLAGMIGWVLLDSYRLRTQLDAATRSLDGARGGNDGERT
jgi:heme exporter protein CcmD